jgi:hypothetical protein
VWRSSVERGDSDVSKDLLDCIFSVGWLSWKKKTLRSFPKKFQQHDTLVQYFIISCKSRYMFRVKQSPIIRSSIKLYLQHLVLTNRVWPAVVVDESELSLTQLLWELHILKKESSNKQKIDSTIHVWREGCRVSTPQHFVTVEYLSCSRTPRFTPFHQEAVR